MREYSIKGHTSGWVRGPYRTLEQARKAAHNLAGQKKETVTISEVTTVRTVTPFESVEAPQ